MLPSTPCSPPAFVLLCSSPSLPLILPFSPFSSSLHCSNTTLTLFVPPHFFNLTFGLFLQSEEEEEETWVGVVGWGGVRDVEVKRGRGFLPSLCRGEVYMAAGLGPDCRRISSVAERGIAGKDNKNRRRRRREMEAGGQMTDFFKD
ncbi:hypothetical protein EXN66_Car022452 [Channa argus]|uniref:Uncharacterized protein n=1 Tax=Channa argus TaxID=215402 RepID=A0A6G1QVP6_CHAAH|nr:hypothetical protein EXN66_Car022452 [Channa argus]